MLGERCRSILGIAPYCMCACVCVRCSEVFSALAISTLLSSSSVRPSVCPYRSICLYIVFICRPLACVHTLYTVGHSSTLLSLSRNNRRTHTHTHTHDQCCRVCMCESDSIFVLCCSYLGTAFSWSVLSPVRVLRECAGLCNGYKFWITRIRLAVGRR